MTNGLLDRIRDRLAPQRSLLDTLSIPAIEALERLIEADGEVVPADRLTHTARSGVVRSPGEWCSAGRAASVICHIRQVLGQDSVITVHGKGYVIGNLPEEL